MVVKINQSGGIKFNITQNLHYGLAQSIVNLTSK